MKKKMTYF